MERAKQKRPLGNYKNLIKMLKKHKPPSLEAGLMIVDKAFGFAQLGKMVYFPVILVVISIFSIGFLSEGKVSVIFGKEEGIVPNSLSEAQTLGKVTGEMVKVKNG